MGMSVSPCQEVIEVANPSKAPELVRGMEWATNGVGGLITAEWEEWMVQRRVVSPAGSYTRSDFSST